MEMSKNFINSTDAKVWASELQKEFDKQGFFVGTPDGVMSKKDFEDWMWSWFASAMTAIVHSIGR